MPLFRKLEDGTPIPIWDDEADPRWVVATFLRSDSGFSLGVADEIQRRLELMLAGGLGDWHWQGNSFRLQANRDRCSLELDDSDLAENIRPVWLSAEELKEIVARWREQIPC